MRRIRPRLLPIAACLILLGSRDGFGAEYSFDGKLVLGQLFDTNINLVPSLPAVWGTQLNLDAGLAVGEPNWRVAGRTRLTNYFYTPTSAIDMQNQYVDASAHYLTDLARYELAGNFTDDYLLSSQADPALGLVLGKLHRRMSSLAPAWTHSLSERARVTLGYSYVRSEYDAAARNYPNSDNHSAFSQLSYAASERLRLEGSLSFTAFNSELATTGNRNAINYVNFSLGLKYSVDPSLDVHASAGGQYSRSQAEYQTRRLLGYALVSLDPPRFAPVTEPATFKTPAQETFGPVFSLGATKRFEKTSLDLSYTRQISPSINSALLQVDSVGLSASREFQPGFRGNAGLFYTHQSYPNFNNQPLDFSYYRVEGGLSYDWSERWSTTASYRYFLRRSEGGDASNQDSHSVHLSLQYNFDPQKF
ncbi:hypothetical protein [Methylomagnum sp.]